MLITISLVPIVFVSTVEGALQEIKWVEVYSCDLRESEPDHSRSTISFQPRLTAHILRDIPAKL